MFLDFLIATFQENKQEEAIVWKDRTFSYEWLLERYNYWRDKVKSNGISKGTIVIVEADFSPNSVALLLALLEQGCVFVPITESMIQNRDEFIGIAEGEFLFKIDKDDSVNISKLKYNSRNN